MPRKATTPALTAKRKAAVLEALAAGGSPEAAAKAARSARSTIYLWRQKDKKFAAAWDEAIEAGTDLLEDEARRRAVEGVERDVYHQGVVVGQERKYSDTLLIFTLKARRPEKYRERTELTGANGGPIETKDVSDVPDRDVARRIAYLLSRGLKAQESQETQA